jgi:hypothetical protein
MDILKRFLRLAVFCQMIVFAATAVHAQTTAVKANDFLNTIGVNTAICYGDDNATTDITLIKQMGFRAVRDDDNEDSACMSTLITVYQQTGAKIVLVPTGQDSSDITNYYIPDNVTLANAGALLALEGPNEPYYLSPAVVWNSQTMSNTASPYWTPVANYQQALYSAVKANATLKNYPVWATTLGGWEANDVGLQYLTIPSSPPDAATLTMPVGTKYADYANVHAYPYYGVFGINGTGPVESSSCDPGNYWNTTPVPNLMWNQDSTDQTLETDDCVFGLYLNYGYTVSPSTFNPAFKGYTAAQIATLPKVMTETAIGESTSGNPYFNVAVTDDQIGRYYMDLFLDGVKEGWTNTFLYEMHDGGDGYGLVDNNYNIRTQGTYLHNFTTILADTSSNFTAGSLTYSVSSEPTTVHDLLLQKSNGTFYVAVWDEEQAGSGITDTVTVNLGANYNIAEFDPTVGTASIKNLTNVSTVSLTLSQSPILLQLSSATAPPAPVASSATSISSTGFSANWATSSGAIEYFLDVSTNSGFTSFVSGYNNLSLGNITSEPVSGLTGSTTYYYRVRAGNSAGTSGNSNTITVTTSAGVTIPAAPVAAAATSITSTGFTSNWAASSGATAYYLDVSTSSSFSTFVSGYNNLSVGNVLSKAITGLTASTTYYYRVRASNSAGTSGNSNIITVTTSAGVIIPAAPVAAAATSISSTGFTSNWAASSGATAYYLDVSTSSSFSSFVTGYNNLSVGNVLTNGVTGLAASTNYYYRVRASNSAGTSGNSNTIAATTSAAGSLPSPWVTSDVGATGTKDSASYSGGVFTVSSGNGDIQGTSDNFRYVDETTSGNRTIIAQITGITDVDDWGKAGVMIRSTTAANAVYAGIFVTVGNGIAFQYRTKAGGSTTAIAANDYGLYWVKLVQSGTSFSAYFSTNGTTWTQVGSTVNITAMPGSATAGLAVSSDTAGDLCTATFSNVSSN